MNTKESTAVLPSDGNLFDPRYGHVRAELTEYLTDTYYNVQKKYTKELRFETCEVESRAAKELTNKLCIRFEARRADNTFDTGTTLKLHGS